MKRSEVIKLIESLFQIADRHDVNANAENLLCHLEELGMTPPSRFDFKNNGSFNSTQIIENRTWEPE